jgi:O-acetylserine/cysteine efflux transporter
MNARDTLLAAAVAAVWGLTFIAIKVGVQETSPLMLSALRFAFAAFPFVLFVRPPKAPALTVVAYGLLIGVGQFGLLFIAIHQGFPVGLASLVVQAQVFFTIGLAWIVMREAPTRPQLIGAAIAAAGMAAIGSERLGGASLGPFLLVVLASFFWGAGNVVAKTAGRIDMFAFTIWSSLAAPLPLILLSLAVEGPRPLLALAHPTWALAIAVAVVSYAGTIFGFGVWARLLSHHPAAAVAPFALLVPVVGMVAAAAIFGETLSLPELFGGLMVMIGLALNVFGGRLMRGRATPARGFHARHQGDPGQS